MRRMFSEKQIKKMIEQAPEEVVKALKGQDINVEGITSKGIANTGNIANTGDIATVGKITGGEIVENMTGYAMRVGSVENYVFDKVYGGIVKNGNKLTIVMALKITKQSGASGSPSVIGIDIPSSVGEKLFPVTIGLYNWLDVSDIKAFSSASSGVSVPSRVAKNSNTALSVQIDTNNMTLETTYYWRYELTFLLSENLIPSGE